MKFFYFIKSFLKFIYLLPNYKIIHIHLSEPVSAFRKIFFFIPALLFNKIIIIHFHSFSPDTTIRGKFKWLYRFLFNNSDTVIVLSEYWKNEIQNSFGFTTTISIIFNPCNFIPSPYIAKNEHLVNNYILFAGTLNARKGYIDLVKAFANISKNYPNWSLYFAGNGEINLAKKIVREYEVDDKTVFLGWIDGIEKNKIFSEASIFCLPSYAEGFPMAVLDAMSYSLPVITTPVGGILDVFTSDEDILIFPPGDVLLLTNHLIRLITDQPLRSKLVNSASNIVEHDFNIDVLARKMHILYSSL